MSMMLNPPAGQNADVLRAERDRAVAEALEQVAVLKDEVVVSKQVIRDLLDTELCRVCFGQRFGPW
jgi:hypothetical protein